MSSAPAVIRVTVPKGSRCQLARFTRWPCDGRLVRCHLIPQRVLRRELASRFDNARDLELAVWDRRTWVWGCGGPMGNGGHHGMLDLSRTLRIPRAVLPVALEEFADQYDLGWYLDREYGRRP